MSVWRTTVFPGRQQAEEDTEVAQQADQPTRAHQASPGIASRGGQAAALPFTNGVTLGKLINFCASFLYL